jgi:hypothetical protein
MMHGHEKSSSAIVAVKPTNKAERSAAEPVEPRAEAEGNAGQQSTHRAQYRVRVAQALVRIRQAIAVVTRGGNRMRESCKYGSVRGRPVMGVPTATAARSSPCFLFHADDAGLAAGFVSEIVEPANLDVAELSTRLAQHAPITMRVSKEAIRRLMHAGLPNGDDLVFQRQSCCLPCYLPATALSKTTLKSNAGLRDVA